MKEYAIFGIVITLLAGVFYQGIASEVSKTITEITTVIERGAGPRVRP